MMSTVLLVLALLALSLTIIVVVPLRRRLLAPVLLRLVARVLPKMGETERIALEAGTVWWDGDLFSGDPDWNK